MAKRFLFICIAFVFVNSIYAQSGSDNFYLPKLALKTNAVYLATSSLNLGLEVGLSKKFTLDVSGNYNPWEFSGGKQIKHWFVQPELRYWPCERFNGHFFGLHGHVGEFNVSGFKILDLDGRRYQGDFYGGGISYGYHWMLDNRWSIEGTVGVGYAHLDYDKYKCGKCGTRISGREKDYWGPTKIGISLIYILK